MKYHTKNISGLLMKIFQQKKIINKYNNNTLEISVVDELINAINNFNLNEKEKKEESSIKQNEEEEIEILSNNSSCDIKNEEDDNIKEFKYYINENNI